jgi:hypothetical protein
MRPRAAAVLMGALVYCVITVAARSAASPAAQSSAGPTIHIEDVERFYKIYSAAGAHPTVDQLQHDYLDPGSDGLHEFARMRKISATAIAATLAKRCVCLS